MAALTVMAQLLSRVEVLRSMPPQAFWPAPKIESALVRMKRDDRLGERAARFGPFVQSIFSYRRKTLRKALAMAGPDAERILSTTGVDPQEPTGSFQSARGFDNVPSHRVVSPPAQRCTFSLLQEKKMAQPVIPDQIMQLGLGFWGSKAFLSAVELGLFTELAKSPLSPRSTSREV